MDAKIIQGLYKKSTIIAVTVVMMVLSILVVYFDVHYANETGLYTSALSSIYGISAAVAVFVAAKTFRKNELLHTSWTMISLGLFLFFLGEVSWLLLVTLTDNHVPYPSVADAFWIAGYIPLSVGIILFLNKIGLRFLTKDTVILVILGSMATFFIFNSVLLPIWLSEIPWLEKSLDLAYPLLDVVLLMLSLVMVALYGRGKLGAPWALLAIAFTLFIFSDLTFSYLTQHNIYEGSGFVDLGWLLSYVLFTGAGWLQLSIQRSLPRPIPQAQIHAPQNEQHSDLVGIV